ncbi:MAG: succinate dehydrogenase/fumarate reductase iron-sulfur subunit [Candidatus Dadabacteria bacterium]|nr:MAG: succinate dehydrogenase/fumarate reductase iron-sulfur subunit [Candidatus Dadabacteria bacterium]
MKLTLFIWRQASPQARGRFERYDMDGVNEEMSFLEMLDVLNERLVEQGKDPVAFDHDCREGICGMCGVVINGRPHGPRPLTTTCQLHMREFNDGDVLYIEPWRAGAFPVIKDLIVDRSALDRVIEAGGYISVNTGSAPDAHSIPVNKDAADAAFDAAACIGCGACVAACPNGSASLFVAAKLSHLGLLPQGQPERFRRTLNMVQAMDEKGFGYCTNFGECQEACPKGISISFIAGMNRDFLKAPFLSKENKSKKMAPQ